MSRENFQYDGLLGLTFIDEDGNEMPAADAMNLEKAQSFGGNRSEAGRYAARARWGARQTETTAASGNKQGLNTDLPVGVTDAGYVYVDDPRGFQRNPTWSERGVPTGEEFIASVKPDLDAIAAIDPVVARKMKSATVNPFKIQLNNSHKNMDDVNDWNLGIDGKSPKSSHFSMTLKMESYELGISRFTGSLAPFVPHMKNIVEKMKGVLDKMVAEKDPRKALTNL